MNKNIKKGTVCMFLVSLLKRFCSYLYKYFFPGYLGLTWNLIIYWLNS